MLKFVVISLLVSQSLALSAKERARATKEALAAIGDSLAKIEVPGSARDVALNAMLRNVAGSEKITPAESTTLGNVRDLLNSVLDMLKADVTTQQTLYTIEADLVACSELRGNGPTLKSEMDTAQTTMQTCRGAEATQRNTVDSACINTMNHIKAIQCPHESAMPSTNAYFDQSLIDTYVTLYTDMLTHFQGVMADWNAQVNVQCLDKSATVSDKIAECNGDQTEFETKACEYEQYEYEACEERHTCWVNKIADHNTLVGTQNAADDTRRMQAAYIKHVICLIENVLIATPEVDLATWATICPEPTFPLSGAALAALSDFGTVVPTPASLAACSGEDEYNDRINAYAAALSLPYAAENFACPNSYSYPEAWAAGLDA